MRFVSLFPWVCHQTLWWVSGCVARLCVPANRIPRCEGFRIACLLDSLPQCLAPECTEQGIRVLQDSGCIQESLTPDMWQARKLSIFLMHFPPNPTYRSGHPTTRVLVGRDASLQSLKNLFFCPGGSSSSPWNCKSIALNSSLLFLCV